MKATGVIIRVQCPRCSFGFLVAEPQMKDGVVDETQLLPPSQRKCPKHGLRLQVRP